MRRRDFLTTPALAVLPAVAQEDGSVSLFDGKTLTGWTVQDGLDATWYVKDGAITKTEWSDPASWLRSVRMFENFDFRCEFYVHGWTEGGIFLHAPEHGRSTWCGMQFKLFLLPDKSPKVNSMGSIFPVVAPLKINVKRDGAWNSMRLRMDWPKLQAWVNEELVQDIDVFSIPELARRLRRGYFGLSSLGYQQLMFRNLRIRELPDKEVWQGLFETDQDFEKNWFISESDPNAPASWELLNGVLRCTGYGHIATREKFKDFELMLYARETVDHNGGVLFRTEGKGLSGRHYEIQQQPVEDAHYPTGSLYNYARGRYPQIEIDRWYLLQLRVEGPRCIVRINGEDILDYRQLEFTDEGHIELQAHRPVRWGEFKQVRVRRL